MSEGGSVESSLQGHRGLRRVDVDICECGGEEMKSEFEAVKALREVLSEGRHVKSSPRKHRGPRRVDVDVCGCGREKRNQNLRP